MDNIQEKLLDLIKRIDETCQKHSITYYLGNETALCAVRWGHFTENCSGASIYMPEEDYDRFEQITMANPEEHTVESMASNPSFPFPFLHYIDKNTTRINLSLIGLQNHPGIAVKVIKLVPYTPHKNNVELRDKIALSALRFEDTFGTIAKYPVNYDVSRLQMLRDSQNLALDIYNSRLIMKGTEKDKFYLQQYWNPARTIAKELFMGPPKEVLLEGVRFKVPCNYRKYLSVLYGRRWQTRDISFSPYSFDFIVDTETPYSHYLPVIQGLQKEAEEYRRVKYEKIPLQTKTNEAWASIERQHYLFERAVDRIYCNDKYKSEKKHILELYRKGAFYELYLLLEDYQERAEKHIKRGVPFAFDKDLYTIMCDLLLWQALPTIHNKMQKSREDAFRYLDETDPDNEQLMDSSIYTYLEDEKKLKKKKFSFGRTIPSMSVDKLEKILIETGRICPPVK